MTTPTLTPAQAQEAVELLREVASNTYPVDIPGKFAIPSEIAWHIRAFLERLKRDQAAIESEDE